MKKLLALAVLGAFGLAATPAFAADNAESKMAMCNKQTAGLKGDERSKAQSECMKATPAKPESKMAMCNKKTAGLKGDERSKAQSECMKGG